MTVSTPKNDTPEISVTHISPHGIWLLAHDEQLFMSYQDFPWFKQQPVEVIQNVEEPFPGHYYWPAMDIDLTKEIIKSPDRFPLMTKVV